jgi:hypothetical protein
MKKCIASLLACRAAPSAIFDGMETEDLRICDTNPYFSSDGNFFVIS